MLVFIGGSGDPGLKIDKGSSCYFTVALVVFEDREEVIACDQRIELLRKELGWKKGEFHFKRNSGINAKTTGVFCKAGSVSC